MMFYKSLVSLLMLFAATSGVTASDTTRTRSASSPFRRGGGYSLPAPIAPGQCQSSQLCCTNVEYGSNPILATVAVLDPSLGVATGCGLVNIIAGNTCQSNTVCCQNVDQTGLINFNCVPIDAAL